MLAGEVLRRQERISALQTEVDQFSQKIAALDSAMALADTRVNPAALGTVTATAERYGGWGGLTEFLESEIRTAGNAGIDTIQLTLRAACRFSIPLVALRDRSRYSDTITWTLRALRKKGVIENSLVSRGGHTPSVWRLKHELASFDELLNQSADIKGAKIVRT